MRIQHISAFTGGWFIGNFEPSVLNTKEFEVGVKFHKGGEKWPIHYHKDLTEYNVLISGMMRMGDKLISPNTIFIMEKKEVAEPTFLVDCTVLVVKVPSIPHDKVIVKCS